MSNPYYTLPVGEEKADGETITAAYFNGQFNEIETGFDGVDTDITALESTRALKAGDTFTGNVTVPSLNSGALGGRRNLLINSDFRVWSRGTSVSVSAGSTGYGPDRWLIACAAGVTATIDQLAMSPTAATGSPYGMRVTFAGATAGSSVRQRIEGAGAYAGKTVTVTIRAANDAVTGHTLTLRQNFGTGGSPSASVDVSAALTLSSSMTTYSATLALASISSKTLGTSGNDCLEVILSSGTGGSQVLDIEYCQIEVGTVATPFVSTEPALERLLCLRYCRPLLGHAAWTAAGSELQAHTLRFDPPMRSTPTLTTNSDGTLSNVTTAVFDVAAANGCRFAVISTAAGAVSVASRTGLAVSEL